MLHIVSVLAGAAICAAATPPASSSPVARATHLSTPLRIAVQQLAVEDVPPRVARVVEAALLEELRKLAGVSVISQDEIQAMLDAEAQRQLLGCEADESCLAEIAGALGADALIIGTLARVGDEHVIGLKRIDQGQARVDATFTKRLTAEDGEEFLAAIGPGVAELFAEVPLRPGRTRGVDPEVALRLNPPPLPTWVFWSGVGVASATLVASGALLAGNAMATAAYQDSVTLAQSQPVSYGTLKGQSDLANNFAAGAWVAGGSAVVLAVATLTSGLFVDWKGYRAAMEEER